MKYHPKGVADIIENVREFAAGDAILRYTLHRLTLETSTNRKRVLDALKTTKNGRPKRQASTNSECCSSARMNSHPKVVADIIENVREFAAGNAIFRDTLHRLTLETSTNRKRVLDLLKTTKNGRPNRQASTNWMFKDVELSIAQFRPEVTAQIKGNPTEKAIIEWAIKKKYFRSEKDGDTPKRLLKRIQDRLSRYRKRLSQKPP